MYNFSNPNLVALAVNISRVYEIAKAGNHTVKIIPSDHCRKQDIDLLNEFYGFEPCSNPDIIAELMYSANDVLNCFSNAQYETIDEINKRIEKAAITVNDSLDTTCITLLKTAIDRLELGANDILIIHRVAKTIAKLSDSTKIKVEHIAEAIQYRSERID